MDNETETQNLDMETVARNILGTLQTDPRAYRGFGIYWWPIKAFLKTYYTQANLYMLGDYTDPEVAEMVPDMPVADMLARALQEYGFNTQFGMGSAQVENEDGETVTIWDGDAGI